MKILHIKRLRTNLPGKRNKKKKAGKGQEDARRRNKMTDDLQLNLVE